ncbi:universal stress protein [Lacisediminimonas profundi]|uniref:universal stress protein n=1 Tax=Lacisediminimonas profundi TaxID=2603856 RepID=UPI00124BB43D|nr:universal stress protein [Lacisediminimonas profundi]
MFKKILVPTDGSQLSERAIEAAVSFASETGASLVAIGVAEAYPFPLGAEGGVVPDMSSFEASLREAAEKHVQHVAELAATKNVSCKTTVVTGFSAADEIVNAVGEFGCDLIWMASHGRTGMQRMLMGSQTQKVLAHAVAPVLVYPLKK